MFNETHESIDLEKDFPQIEDINGFIEAKPSVGSSEKSTSVYRKQHLPHGFIHCENPLCKHGGVPLGEEFRFKLLEMVKGRQEEGILSTHCRGYENMGPGHKRQCLHTSITVNISVKYKS